MAKSKTTEERVDAQEVAALKIDMEQVSKRTEEIGSKVDGVQQQMATLTEQVSRLEHLLRADHERPVEPAKATQHQQPPDREQAKENTPSVPN
jgi:hypothetical protein